MTKASIFQNQVSVATWNIASVNNNPFEYWITYPDETYNEFMLAVEKILNDPKEDLFLHEIFTDVMFEELKCKLGDPNSIQIYQVEEWWKNNYRNRMAIFGFLKDKILGEKRLVSMPDRITNTVQLEGGKKLTRPTVINAYDGPLLLSVDVWWSEWKRFMFETPVAVHGGDARGSPGPVYKLIGPIHRNKYPAITLSEQAISAPLQLLCLAAADAILVHIANRAAPASWEGIRRRLCSALIHGRDARACDILHRSYASSHIIFLQEVSSSFVRAADAHAALSASHALLLPTAFDGARDQNSAVLVHRCRFRADTCADVTRRVLDCVAGDFLAPGDLFAASVADAAGRRWLLVSFHGDGNGLSTRPALAGLHAACQVRRRRRRPRFSDRRACREGWR